MAQEAEVPLGRLEGENENEVVAAGLVRVQVHGLAMDHEEAGEEAQKENRRLEKRVSWKDRVMERARMRQARRERIEVRGHRTPSDDDR
jgi:uncharacterized membrane protein